MPSPFHWQPLGKLFDPDNQPILGKQLTFSQSPQAIELDGRIRVYFTSRWADSPQTFISLPAYADFDHHFAALLGVAENSLLPNAALGAFDEHGIFPFSPTPWNGELLAYTTGWSRRRSVSVETGIGLARSRDGGHSFERIGAGPVLTASLHEPFLVGDAFVRHFEGQFHMWYMYGTKWQSYGGHTEPERTYKIGHAISADGINWQKEEARQLLPDVLGETESQALPSVAYFAGCYHMVFCYRESTGFRASANRGYRLGYAWSHDLNNWHRDDALLNLTPQGDWDSDTMCYPNFFVHDDALYLLYCGNLFGRHGFGALRLLEPSHAA